MSIARSLPPAGRLDIALGCGSFGGTDWGEFNEETAAGAVARALDLGVVLFDTADVYGLGGSEEFLARVLTGCRERVCLITKGGVGWGARGPDGRAMTFRDNSRDHLRKAVGESLVRLRVDHIPLYVVHWPDNRTPIEEVLNTLDELKREGKIGAAGLSNFPLGDVSDAMKLGAIDVLQMEVNLLVADRARPLLRAAATAGVPVMAYAPLGHGLLTGKYTSATRLAAGDYRHRLMPFQRLESGEYDGLLSVLVDMARRRACSPGALAIAWARSEPGVSTVIVGARSADQLQANVEGLAVVLDDDDRRALGDAAPQFGL